MPSDSPIAANLASLRAERNLSQAELGQAAGLSRVGLGKIERGETLPRARTLSALARALDVPLDRLVLEQRPLRQVRFRAPSRVNGREAILGDVAAWLDGYVGLEEATGAKPDGTVRRLMHRSYRSPTEAAVIARRECGLGSEPVRDICGLLEQRGVKVLLLRRVTEAFFGLSVGLELGGPAVVVNAWERISVERWIFSAAHELGHLLLHLADDSFDRGEAQERPEEERAADAFASAFLMPEETFCSEWDETQGHALLDRVLKVKRIFRVSYKTVLLRLISSGRADCAIWPAFQRQHRDRYGKTLKKADEPHALSETDLTWLRAHEPERLSEADFGGDRQHRLVRHAIDDGLITMARAAELLRLPLEDMRQLARRWYG